MSSTTMQKKKVIYDLVQQLSYLIPTTVILVTSFLIISELIQYFRAF